MDLIQAVAAAAARRASSVRCKELVVDRPWPVPAAFLSSITPQSYRATSKTSSLSKVWHDAGFKKTFAKHCRKAGIDSEVVKRISPNSFEVIPRRWVVERTWGWLTNHRRLRIDPRT